MKESTNSRLGRHWFARRQMARPLQLRNRTFPSPKFACLVLPYIDRIFTPLPENVFRYVEWFSPIFWPEYREKRLTKPSREV
jgi:hypothetical protein